MYQEKGGVRWGSVGNNRKRGKKYYFKKNVYNRQINVGVL